MRDSRRKQMQEYLAQNDTATMDELCQKFGISINTARADVAYLVKQGVAKKVYGGVSSMVTAEIPIFSSRAVQMNDVKRKIAAYAAKQIGEQDIVYIDAGTTTAEIVDFIEESLNITMITSNIEVIVRASQRTDITLVVLPGVLDHRTKSLIDASTYRGMAQYNVDKAFMAATGITADGQVNNTSYLECEVKRVAMEKSVKRYLLADSSKFGKTALMSYGSLDMMEMVITDENIPLFFEQLCKEKETKVVKVS